MLSQHEAQKLKEQQAQLKGPGYGGLIRPKHLHSVKVPNRGYLSIENGDGD